MLKNYNQNNCSIFLFNFLYSESLCDIIINNLHIYIIIINNRDFILITRNNTFYFILLYSMFNNWDISIYFIFLAFVEKKLFSFMQDEISVDVK